MVVQEGDQGLAVGDGDAVGRVVDQTAGLHVLEGGLEHRPGRVEQRSQVAARAFEHDAVAARLGHGADPIGDAFGHVARRHGQNSLD